MLATGLLRNHSAVLAVDDVADPTHVKPQTVYGWMKAGQLKGMKAGRRWLTTRQELEAFIERCSGEVV